MTLDQLNLLLKEDKDAIKDGIKEFIEVERTALTNMASIIEKVINLVETARRDYYEKDLNEDKLNEIMAFIENTEKELIEKKEIFNFYLSELDSLLKEFKKF